MTIKGRHTLTLFVDKAGFWRWNRRASNGRIVSDSAEGYVDRRDALHGMRIANSDWRECRLIGAGSLALTEADVDEEETL